MLFFALALTSSGLLFILPWGLASFHATSAPAITSLVFSETEGGAGISSVNLVEGNVKNVYVQAEVSDADSCEDITLGGNASLHLYLATENAACVDNPYNCYHQYSCSFSNCTDNTDTDLTVSCSVGLASNAANTATGPLSGGAWVGELVVEDSNLQSDTYGFGFEINSLLAYTLDAMLDYGTLNLNQLSSAVPIYVENTGNTGMDLELESPNPMTCSAGSIPANATKVSDASGFDYAMGHSIDTPYEMELNLTPSEDEFPSSQAIYFRLQMPESGASGICSNTIYTTAIADTESGF